MDDELPVTDVEFDLLPIGHGDGRVCHQCAVVAGVEREEPANGG